MAPILFLTYNRPNQTKLVLDRILAAKPDRLYIAQDGPKSLEDIGWQQVRNILLQTQVEGDVVRWLSDKHQGCKNAVSHSIQSFFDREEKGIILEDDTLPSPHFFRFCDDLLIKFEHHPEIGMISGNNKNGFVVNGCSYEAIPTCQAWGWATWKRAWRMYDIEMKYWPELGHSSRFSQAHQNLKRHKFIQYQQTFEGKIDTWDYQWEGSMLNNGLSCIIPARNLIQNIGFGMDATHTFEKNEKEYNSLHYAFNFPLIHPF